MPITAEDRARQIIDQLLEEASWEIQDMAELNVHSGNGVAVREFPLSGEGFADYMLFVDGKACGVIEANLKRAERLRQAILKRAFEGRLVPTEAALAALAAAKGRYYESATDLLARFKAERDATPAPTKKRRGEKKAG